MRTHMFLAIPSLLAIRNFLMTFESFDKSLESSLSCKQNDAEY